MYDREKRVPGPLPSYLIDFGRLLRREGCSEGTIFEYMSDAALFLRFIQGDMSKTDISGVTENTLDMLTESDVTEYLDYCLTVPKDSMITLRRKLAALRKFFRFTISCGLRTTDPMANISTPKVGKRELRYLRREECITLLDSILDSPKELNRQRDYFIFTLLLNTGLRLDELRGLNENSISVPKMCLTTIGKGNKERIVPINGMILGAMEDYMPVRKALLARSANGNLEQALFITVRKEQACRISREAIQKLVKTRLRAAGFDASKYHVHTMRHSAATLMNVDGDIRTVQEILGHASIATTQLYCHANEQKMRAVVQSNPLNFGE